MAGFVEISSEQFRHTALDRYIQTHSQTNTHKQTHTYTHTHTHTRTHTHTHTHTYAYIVHIPGISPKNNNNIFDQ